MNTHAICPICFESLEADAATTPESNRIFSEQQNAHVESVVILNPCHHKFCYDCIIKWCRFQDINGVDEGHRESSGHLKSEFSGTCPLCRTPHSSSCTAETSVLRRCQPTRVSTALSNSEHDLSLPIGRNNTTWQCDMVKVWKPCNWISLITQLLFFLQASVPQRNLERLTNVVYYAFIIVINVAASATIWYSVVIELETVFEIPHH